MPLHGAIAALIVALSLILPPSVARADYAGALAAFNEGDYATALAEFTPMAQRGDTRAQFHLGEMYFNGWGVEADHREAFRWYRRGAENGYGAAQLRLGSMLALGLGADMNLGDAYYWLVLSVLWSDGPMRRHGLQALQDVASHLDGGERAELERAAKRAWE